MESLLPFFGETPRLAVPMLLHSRSGRRLMLGASVALTALVLVMLSLVTSHPASADPVGLGSASSFAVLGGETVTNVGSTTISGDLGVNPGSAVTGGPRVINGDIYVADAVSLQAKNDARTAYDEAAGRPSTAAAPPDLAGAILTPGVYTGDRLALTGTLVLDGLNDPSSVFVFQSAADLITAPNSVVTLVNGASACNVFWQVASSATLDTNTVFVGTLLASTSITANFGTDVQGRLLTDTGEVTLDTATVALPICTPATTTTATVTAAGPTITETTTAAGSTATVTTGPTTTETLTSGPATTVTAPGATTTIFAATETLTATVVLSVLPNGQTVAVQTLAPSGNSSTAGGAAPNGSAAPSGLAFTGSSATTLTLSGLALVVLGGATLLLVRRAPARPRRH